MTSTANNRGRAKADIFALALVCLVSFFALRTQFARGLYTTGDRGRDLYTAMLVAQDGKLSYRDFDWPYGPLMPLYYAGWFRARGISMLSYEWGETCLRFASVPAVYWMARAGLGAAGAAVTAILFHAMVPVPYTTGNHVGGLLALALFQGFLLRLITGRGRKRTQLIGCSLSLVILALVKLNMALAFGGAAALCAALLRLSSTQASEDDLGSLPKCDFITARDAMRWLGLFVIPVALVYVPLVLATPTSSLRICFPYLPGSHIRFDTIWERLRFESGILKAIAAKQHPLNTLAQLLLAFRGLMLVPSIGVAVLAVVIEWQRNRLSSRYGRIMLVLLLSLLAGAHEFILAGSTHSISYWCTGSMALLPVVIAGRLWPPGGGRNRARTVAIVLSGGAILGVLMVGLDSYIRTAHWDLVDHPRGGIYHARGLRERTSWARTVSEASARIEELTDPGEPIVVVPFEPVYLFLTGRPHACRLVDFSYYNYLDLQQQEDIIWQIEQKRVRVLVWGNTVYSIAGKVEDFGQTHSRRLGSYLLRRYADGRVFAYGEKEMAGCSAYFHGVKISVIEWDD